MRCGCGACCRPSIRARHRSSTAVQGHAFGGALGLIACSDIAVAAEDAQFAFSEVRLGHRPGGHLPVRAPAHRPGAGAPLPPDG